MILNKDNSRQDSRTEHFIDADGISYQRIETGPIVSWSYLTENGRYVKSLNHAGLEKAYREYILKSAIEIIDSKRPRLQP